MKTHRPLLVATVVCFASSLAQAADYYLQRNQSQGWHWGSVGAGTAWFPAARGGNAIEAIDPGGTYHSNGFQIRTREAAKRDEIDLFGGAKLILDGGEKGSLTIKSTGAATAKVDSLLSIGGSIFAGSGSTPQNFHVGTLEQRGATTIAATATGRGYNLVIENLTGDGLLKFEEQQVSDKSTRFNIAINEAIAYVGDFAFAVGALRFDADLAAVKSTVTFAPGSVVNLNGKSLMIAGLKIGDTQIPAGKHTSADLSRHGLKASGEGDITVIYGRQ